MRFGQVSSKNLSSPNWLKFGAGVHCYILILNLMFIFSKFFKLVEIWYKGKLLYVYYDYKVYFFKILFIKLFFWQIGVKIWISSNWLKFRTGVNALLHTYYDFNVHFFKIFVILIFFALTMVSESEIFPNWLKFGSGVHYYMLIQILTLIFLKFFSVLLFWVNFVQKFKVLQINWNLVQRYIDICLWRFWRLFFHFFFNFFGQIWFQNLNFIKLTEIS